MMCDCNRIKVAIVGAGIAGLSSAVRLLEQYPDTDATVIADAFSPNTTSDGAAGYWRPFQVGIAPDHLETKRSVATWYYLNDLLLKEGDSNQIGLSRCCGFLLSDEKEELPPWAKYIPGNRQATKEELAMYFGDKARYGQFGPSIMCEFRLFSRFLTERFQMMGGKVQHGRIKHLADLADHYDVVFNCTGNGATGLCNDPLTYTMRGHVIRVKAPWVRNYLVDFNHKDDEQFTHILPNIDSVVIGGTKMRNNMDPRPAKEQREKIMKRAIELEPSLKNAEILSEWVGFRPAREMLRLEREDVVVCGKDKRLPVIHNYGMSGSGLSIGWGCAIDAVDIFANIAKGLHKNQFQAKL